MLPRARYFRAEMHVRAGLICNELLIVECTLRKLSEERAIVEVATSRGIPREVDLIIEKSLCARHCRIVWRSRTRLGLALRPNNRLV
jgi:hypothetical protein